MAGSSKSRQAKRPSRKPPLTREMLLPLPPGDARAISLENHLALAAMRSGHGNADLMLCLLKAMYMTYFLHEAAYGRTGFEPFREAECVLDDSLGRAERNEGWSLPQTAGAIIGDILTLYERQLAFMPVHALTAARARLIRYLASERLSPIPQEKAATLPTQETSSS